MSCTCYKKKMLKRMDRLIQEVRLFRKLMFPISQPTIESFGKTRTLEEVEIDMVTFMRYEQDLGNLPEAVGPNKDITKGVLIVKVDGAESMRTDCAYDLNTRAPLAPVPWQAPKGKDVTLELEFEDDDGNSSPITQLPFGVAKDTISPDAPSDASLGTTRVIDEVDVP